MTFSGFCQLFLFVFVFTSCGSENKEVAKNISVTIPEEKPLKPQYAKGFYVEIEGGIRKLKVVNPFKNYEVENTYVLLKNEDGYTPLPGESVIHVPITKVAALSTSFYSMIDALEMTETIVAVESENIIFSQAILSGIAKGNIVSVGGDQQLNIEKALLLNPDVVMINGYGNELPESYKKIKRAGINVMINYDWKEETPLARAEWIKYFGILYDQEDKADSIFRQIESNYTNTKAVLDSIEKKPKVLFSSMYNGVWYIPGGKSYVAQYLKDAKGTYPWQEDTSTGSLALSMETVSDEMLDADVWIGSNHYSLSNLEQDDKRYAQFKPYKTGFIFENDRRTTKLGGNDFWETGALRVDLILQDYINMLHPGVLEDRQLNFFRKLEKK